jgi:hypothetical protein
MDSCASDLLTMHKLGRRADGGSAIVRWLTRRTGCWVGLVDRSGTVLLGDRAALDGTTAPALTRAAQDMAGRGLRAFSTVDRRTCRIVLVQVDRPDPAAPNLALVGTRPVPQALTAGAATVLGTFWSAERTRRTRKHLDDADERTREAVLNLLLARQTSTARRIASVLGRQLPDPARLYVIACPPRAREAVVDSCGQWAARSTFVVPSPGPRRHTIVIAPAGATDRDAPCLATALTARHVGCVVGASDVVTLSDAPVGYRQALHALTVARGCPEGRATFDDALDPVTLLGADGTAWAAALLAPLTGHVPSRATDPDAAELMATLRAWLSFSTVAAGPRRR